MSAILGLILVLFAWFEIAIKAANVPVFISWPALAVLAVAAIAAELYWPTLRYRRAPRQ
jgi:hypothetical protein